MPSRFLMGGIGRQHFNVIGRLRFFVESGGTLKGVVTVRAHPDDLDEARKAFRPSRLEDALSTAGSALMVASVFTSSFQGICLAGLVAGRGIDFAKSDLIERAFPTTADRLLFYANSVHDKAVANKVKFGRRKTTNVAKSAAGSEKGDKDTGGCSGSAVGGSDTGSGSAGGSDSGLGSAGGSGSDDGSEKGDKDSGGGSGSAGGSVGGLESADGPGSDGGSEKGDKDSGGGSGSSGGSDSGSGSSGGSDGGSGSAGDSDGGGGLGSALADLSNLLLA